MAKKTNTANYDYSIGRRKRSTAVVKLSSGKGEFNVIKDGQEISLKKYFAGNHYLYEDAMFPFLVLGGEFLKRFDAAITVVGGGIRGQAESIRLGFARALIKHDPEIRVQLKPYGLLKRDPRRKERKKPGLKKARKAPQWSKR